MNELLNEQELAMAKRALERLGFTPPPVLKPDPDRMDADRMAARRQKLIALGKCVQCGQRKAVPGLRRCRECGIHHREYVRRRLGCQPAGNGRGRKQQY